MGTILDRFLRFRPAGAGPRARSVLEKGAKTGPKGARFDLQKHDFYQRRRKLRHFGAARFRLLPKTGFARFRLYLARGPPAGPKKCPKRRRKAPFWRLQFSIFGPPKGGPKERGNGKILKILPRIFRILHVLYENRPYLSL